MREKMRLLRRNKGFTQQDMSEMCGISRTHYTQIETGSPGHNPSLEVGLKIKAALEYDGDDIFLNSDVANCNNELFT